MPQPTGIALFDGLTKAINAVFGESLTLTRAGDVAVEIKGVFDARYYEVIGDGNVPISDYQISVSCRRDAAGNVQPKDLVEARGAVFEVTDVRPDSEGGVVLALRLRQAP